MAQRPDVMGNLQKALQAVEHIKGLQGDIQGMGQLGGLLEETKDMVGVMAGSVQSLEQMLLIQREVSLRLCAQLTGKDTEEALDGVRKMETQIRRQVLAENDLEEP